MLERATLICAQSNADAQRLKSLGVAQVRVEVTGNLKFDAALPPSLPTEAAALRRQWGTGRPIFIAASTHGGEEKKILAAFNVLRQAYKDLLLVLVPRHPERFKAVARLCRRSGVTVALRSQHRDVLPAGTAILVGDTMGELQRLYAAADIAFVGGSLVRTGGHNLLEPCAVGIPVLFGPHIFHFEEISTLVLECGAGSQVPDESGLADAVALYLEQPALREAAGEAARALVAENSGSVGRTLRLMAETSRCARPEPVTQNSLSALHD